MITEKTRIKKFEQELKEKLDINLELYKKRFSTNKPMQLKCLNAYPHTYEINYEKWGEEDLFGLYVVSSEYGIKKAPKDLVISAYYKGKKNLEAIKQLKVLDTIHVCSEFAIHRSIVEQMQAIAPDDFEIIPMVIHGKDKNGNPFELHDYCNINILNIIHAFDEKRSKYNISKILIETKDHKIVYRDDPWQDGAKVTTKNNEQYFEYFKLDKPCKIAIDAHTGKTLWHPELARLIPFDTYHWFALDIEALYYLHDYKRADYSDFGEKPKTLLARLRDKFNGS